LKIDVLYAKMMPSGSVQFSLTVGDFGGGPALPKESKGDYLGLLRGACEGIIFGLLARMRIARNTCHASGNTRRAF